MARRDPLENPAPLIQRVYAYVAYRLGDGPDAEDVTNDVFERALRYRSSYDATRGGVLPWLFGIAKRCVDDALRGRPQPFPLEPVDPVSLQDVEAETVQRLSLAVSMEVLDERARDLLALRYGADLSARQIGETLGLKTNAVEVALHRTLARLRNDLADDRETGRVGLREASPRPLP